MERKLSKAYALSLLDALSAGDVEAIISGSEDCLDYSVTNGRYQGTSNAIGNDGLWRSPEGHCVLVEVKTTDTGKYLNLDRFAFDLG